MSQLIKVTFVKYFDPMHFMRDYEYADAKVKTPTQACDYEKFEWDQTLGLSHDAHEILQYSSEEDIEATFQVVEIVDGQETVIHTSEGEKA